MKWAEIKEKNVVKKEFLPVVRWKNEKKKLVKKIHSKALISRHFPNEKGDKIQGRERANTRVLFDLNGWLAPVNVYWTHKMDALISVCPNMSNCYTEEGHSPQLNMQITLRTSKLTSDFSLFFFLFIWKFLFSLQLDRRRDRLLLRFKLHIHIYSKSSYIRERQRVRMGEKRIKEQNQWTQLVARLLHNVNTHGYTSRKDEWWWARKKK